MKKYTLIFVMICSSLFATAGLVEAKSENVISIDPKLADLQNRLDALEQKIKSMDRFPFNPRTVESINAFGRVSAFGVVIFVVAGVAVLLKSKWDQRAQEQKKSDVDDLDDVQNSHDCLLNE